MSRKEEYQWYKSIGICPVCHKTAIQKGYQTCLECRLKMREYAADRKSRMNAEQLGDISRRTAEANKRMYVRRKEANLCTQCGKDRLTMAKPPAGTAGKSTIERDVNKTQCEAEVIMISP